MKNTYAKVKDNSTAVGVRSTRTQLSILLIVMSMGLSQFASAQINPTVTTSPSIASAVTTGTAQGQADAVKREMDAAIFRVKQIVNQPVRQFRLGPNMTYQIFNEGWFHEGAAKPDFNTIDIRPHQVTTYAQFQYVTSPLNRGYVFHGPDLGFNPQTKYFITDRTTPKKKLTEAEMIEINGFYRIIGKCETELNRLMNPTPTPAPQAAATPPVDAAEAAHYVQPTGRQGISNMAGKLVLVGVALIAGFFILRRFFT